MLALLLVLGACAEKEKPVQENSNEATSDIRKIDTVMGEVEVPTNPERVVVDWDLGHVVALGVEPVGASKTTLEYGLLLKQFVTDLTEEIGQDGQVSYEKVLDLNPDLIITWNREQVEEYEKIAPTVVFETQNYDGIHEQLTAMGEILNKQDEAKKWLTDFDQRIADAKSKVEEAIPAGSTFTIIDAGTTKEAIVVGETAERGGLAAYQSLKLTPQEKVKSELIDKGENRADVSWESISDFTGDYIFLITQGEEAKADLPSTWDSLDAVKKGHVIELNVKEYFTGDPISTLLQAEDMAEKISALAKEEK